MLNIKTPLRIPENPTEEEIAGVSDLWKLRHKQCAKPKRDGTQKDLMLPPDHMKSFDELNFATSPRSDKSKRSIRSKCASSFYKSGFLDVGGRKKKPPPIEVKRYTDAELI